MDQTIDFARSSSSRPPPMGDRCMKCVCQPAQAVTLRGKMNLVGREFSKEVYCIKWVFLQRMHFISVAMTDGSFYCLPIERYCCEVIPVTSSEVCSSTFNVLNYQGSSLFSFIKSEIQYNPTEDKLRVCLNIHCLRIPTSFPMA